MNKITPFLWFDDNAEEAMHFYVSIFKNSKMISGGRSGEEGPDETVMSVRFELEGQEFIALNGGPHYKFTPAISLFVSCRTQSEVDELWGKLAEGGSDGQCGWIQDKYGLSWQIIPDILGELMADPDPEKAERVRDAMMQMTKIDIEGLQRAYAST